MRQDTKCRHNAQAFHEADPNLVETTPELFEQKHMLDP